MEMIITEMRGRTKAVIIIIPAAVVLFLIIGIGSQLYVNTNPDQIAGITQFFVIEDGSITKLRFSLVDNEGYVAASDAMVKVDAPFYNQEFNISASDFKQYQLQLTGQPIYAYAWQTTEALGSGTVFLTVTLPNGKVFTASDEVF